MTIFLEELYIRMSGTNVFKKNDSNCSRDSQSFLLFLKVRREKGSVTIWLFGEYK